ncbi:MAG: DUF2793 domain-containing protein [Pseudomonadota bacterium]
MATPNLNLPLIAEGQAQPHVTHNEAVDMIDALWGRTVVSATLAVAPTTPNDGAAYIVPPSGSGFDPATPGQIALWHGGIWHKIEPRAGWRMFVSDEGRSHIFDGSTWAPGDVVGALGSSVGLATLEADLTLTGATVTATDLIPDRAIVLGVTSWVIEAVTGATSYRVGTASSDNQFGGSLGVAAGSSNIGVVGPFATYSPEDVIVTAEGGNFTGGRIGLAAAVILPGV